MADHYTDGYRRPAEATGLAAVVSRHSQVVRLLCGHVHTPVQRPWAGTQATIMASVAVDVRKGVERLHAGEVPMYDLHVMSEEAGLVSHTRVVNDS